MMASIGALVAHLAQTARAEDMSDEEIRARVNRECSILSVDARVRITREVAECVRDRQRRNGHPIYGDIPAIYAPPISEEVATCAQRIAADLLARADARGEGELIRGNTETRGTQHLYRCVRAAMGRAPVAIIDGSAPYPLDDESISEGIIRAINTAD